jgi:hypothetical protein
MRHFHPNDPDTKPAKLAATTFWFEELEPIRGMMLDGCAEIDIDGFGNWVLGTVTIGHWSRNIRGVSFGRGWVPPHFTGETFEIYEESDLHQSGKLWELIRAWLVRKYDDEITEQCIQAGEG